jgi:VRR-NUC domain protein
MEENISIRIENIEINLLRTEEGKYISKDKEYDHIEEIALNYFSSQGYKGVFSQNFYWSHIFSFLFWQEIWAIIDLKYQSDKFPKYIKKSFELEKIPIKQDMPFDLFTDVFLKNREEIIAYKMKEIIEKGGEKILEENYRIAKEQCSKNNNRIFRMLEHNIDRFEIDDLKLVFKYHDIEDVMKVFLFYINDIPKNRSGFPDLLIFNDDELKFVEVKGPNDMIKEHQIEKIILLNQNNIKSEILTINHTERKLNNLAQKIRNSESINVKYPEELSEFLKKSKKYILKSYLDYGEKENIFMNIIILFFIISLLPFYLIYLFLKKKK